MNIMFRCAYCNQLMKIGSRKAGRTVQCPNPVCGKDIIVPFPDDGAKNEPEQPQPVLSSPQGREAGLFEQNDFEKLLLEGSSSGPQAVSPAKPPASPAQVHRLPPNPGLADYRPVPPRPERGMFVTSGMLGMVSALAVLLMGMAFFLGLLLGRSSQP